MLSLQRCISPMFLFRLVHTSVRAVGTPSSMAAEQLSADIPILSYNRTCDVHFSWYSRVQLSLSRNACSNSSALESGEPRTLLSMGCSARYSSGWISGRTPFGNGCANPHGLYVICTVKLHCSNDWKHSTFHPGITASQDVMFRSHPL